MRADPAFWHAYAIRNNIRSHGSVSIAAARAWSAKHNDQAVVMWPNGRETIFRDGFRVC